jgi:outer membrane protein
MSRMWLSIAFCLLSMPAFAGKIAVVDFQRAVQETTEGKAAQTKLDSMYASRKTEIEKMKKDFDAQVADFKAKELILNDEAKAKAARALSEKQASYQKISMQYEQEMQETYYSLLADLDEKIRALSAKIAKEKTYDLLLDSAAVVYSGGETIDLTDELIRRYNAQPKP